MDKKLIARFIIRETMGTVILAVILFWAGGTVRWWQAWALTVLVFAWATATMIVALRSSPDLLAERLGPRTGAKKWDTILMSIVGIGTLGRLVIAGLDHRYGWSGELSLFAQVIALIVTGFGYVLPVWAAAVNAYFSQIVRIQEERGHTVATGGPYKWVRHPAYVGTVLCELATPVLLGSWWALIFGALNAVLFIVRTAKEDATLIAELDGYDDYARQTRYRLFPGIW
jgi:protein-S-isoprenylcysteine O-methyltransferase Ste14